MTEYTKRPIARYLATLVLLGIVALGICWWIYDWHLIEKVLTRLAMPVGILWLLLVASVVVAWARDSKRDRIVALLMLVVYWGLFNTFTAEALVGRLERQFAPVDVTKTEPFDALVVLGGGTSSDAHGNIWLNSAGERIALPARLYHAGKASRLICTGEVQSWSHHRSAQLSEGTQRIWEALDIPPQVITRVGGKNTSQEIKQVKDLFGEQSPSRVGLVTSAFHLPRAMRLARAQNLEITPVPAGYLGNIDEPLPLAILPNSYASYVVELSLKEFLAGAVGR